MSKVKTKQIVISMVAILFALIMLSPFYIGIIYSFKTKQEITLTGLSLPTHFDFQNYVAVLEDGSFFKGMLNSIYTTIPSVILLMIICPMASYVFARNKKRIYNVLYSLFLVAMLIPYQSVLLPIYADMRLGNVKHFCRQCICEGGVSALPEYFDLYRICKRDSERPGRSSLYRWDGIFRNLLADCISIDEICADIHFDYQCIICME